MLNGVFLVKEGKHLWNALGEESEMYQALVKGTVPAPDLSSKQIDRADAIADLREKIQGLQTKTISSYLEAQDLENRR